MCSDVLEVPRRRAAPLLALLLLGGCQWIADFSSRASDGGVDASLDRAVDLSPPDLSPPDLSPPDGCATGELAPRVVRSCMVHGAAAGAAEHCLDLTCGGTEPRPSGAGHRLVVEPPAELAGFAPTAVEVRCTRAHGGRATLGSAPGGAISVLLVDPLPGVDCCEVTLVGAGEQRFSFHVRTMVGDFARPGDGVVDVVDGQAWEAHKWQPIASPAAAACDANLDGAVDVSDEILWNSRVGSEHDRPCLLAVEVESCHQHGPAGSGAEACLPLGRTGVEPRQGGVALLRLSVAPAGPPLDPAKTRVDVRCGFPTAAAGQLSRDQTGELRLALSPPIPSGSCCEIVVLDRGNGFGLRFWARALTGDVIGPGGIGVGDGLVDVADEQAVVNIDENTPFGVAGAHLDVDRSGFVDGDDVAAVDARSGERVTACPRPLASVRSCHTHGAAGEFCLALDDLRPEPRAPGVQQLRLTPAWGADVDPLETAELTVFCLEGGVPQQGPVPKLRRLETGELRLDFVGAQALPLERCCAVGLGEGRWWATWVVVRSQPGDVHLGVQERVDPEDLNALALAKNEPVDQTRFWFDLNLSGAIDDDDNPVINEHWNHSTPRCLLPAAEQRSCKVHGAFGRCCVAIEEQGGYLSSEPRQGGVTELELSFGAPAAVEMLATRGGTVDCAGGGSGAAVLLGRVQRLGAVEAALLFFGPDAPLPDLKCCRLSVPPSVRGLGYVGRMQGLLGDVDRDNTFDNDDLNAVEAAFYGGWPLSREHCARDIDVDGAFDQDDVDIVSALSERSADPCGD